MIKYKVGDYCKFDYEGISLVLKVVMLFNHSKMMNLIVVESNWEGFGVGEDLNVNVNDVDFVPYTYDIGL